MVSEEDLENGSLYPPLNTIKDISVRVATRVAEFAYEKGRVFFEGLKVLLSGIY